MRGFRVGIVNPFCPFGKRIRKLLQDRSFPVIELKLFETRTNGGSSLTKFQNEVLITQPLDPNLFPHLDLIFFDGDEREGVATKAAAAAREGVLVIVSGATGVEAPVVAPGINDESISEQTRLVVAARSPSILAGTVLASLTRCFEVLQSCGTLLLPASERGEEAVEELHQQVVNILSFKSPPMKIFREQLAFNLTLASGSGKMASLDEEVAKETAQLAGMGGGVAISLLQAPVFHGYALSLWVRLAEYAEQEAVAKALRASRRMTFLRSGKRSPRIPSPVSVADSDKIHVGWVRRDGSSEGWYWLWVVADSLALDPAVHAVRVAEKILGITKDKK